MLPSPIPRSLLFAVAFVPLAANAQSTAHRDSLRRAIADHRSHMQVSDSMGDARGSVVARLELAPLVGVPERLRLLEDAAAGAQSAALLEEEIMVRKQLAEALDRAGRHERAYEESMHVTALVEARSAERRMRSTAHEDSLRMRLIEERDSLQAVWQAALQQARYRESHMEATAERWFFYSIGGAFVALVAIVVLGMRSSRRIKAFRDELKSLRDEVTELKKPRNTYRPAPDQAPIAPVPLAPVEALPAPLRLPSDALAAGMFLRSAPERLSTFKEARARSDYEKAVRVVHTLKPLLASVDADRFTPLCARLVAPDAAGGDAWNSDADALTSMIEVLLQQH